MKNQHGIISNWIMQGNEPLVSIICTTFNQENFIRETLEGFLIQETKFSFEIIVHDDASTDDTLNIVKEFVDKYPLIIKPIYQKENQYSKKEINIWSDFTFPMAQGKYIALCEGDDYWIDVLKLQKQVDFLESNDDYVITWTDFFTKKGTELVPNDFKDTLPSVYTIDFDNLFVPYCTYTLTCLFRKSAVDPLDYKKFTYGKDNTLYSLALCHGKGAYMNFKSAVYRWHPGGIYSLKSAFFQRYSSYLNLKEIYECIPEARTKNVAKIMNSLLKYSAQEALKLVKDKNQDKTEPKKAIKAFLANAGFLTKIKFLWRYIKA
ncbi:glycosyltransferase [Flavobacterium sp. KMS]|uniref:glycosyltransferase n=1 Tax=Flavobacterium sp. KMS TaxID=1566023 RepID=UPI00068BD22B|nr:glycosyltransferase [Flavobacterium sp. KMS]